VIDRLEMAVPDILESAMAISLLCLHLLVNKPEGMDMAWDITENGQGDVDEQVTAATSDEPSRGRWEQDSNDDEDNV